MAAGLLPSDLYVKRVASRVLMQYATLARGDDTVSERLWQDMLFFCAQAYHFRPGADPGRVRQAYRLDRFTGGLRRCAGLAVTTPPFWPRPANVAAATETMVGIGRW